MDRNDKIAAIGSAAIAAASTVLFAITARKTKKHAAKLEAATAPIKTVAFIANTLTA